MTLYTWRNAEASLSELKRVKSEGVSDYLQVELQTMSPLLQDFGNPVSDMFRRHLRWLYALL